jgi:hypothetical protein
MLSSFPIKINVLVKYRNGIDIWITRGLYLKETVKTEQGPKDKRYLVIRLGQGRFVKLPAPPQSAYYDFEGRRVITLLRVDVNTYLPVTWQNGKWNTISYEPKLDENGHPVKNAKGEVIREEVEVPIFNGNIALEDGKLVDVPWAIAHKTFDALQWLSHEYIAAEQEYKATPRFWERYAPHALLFIFGIILIVGGSIYLGEMHKIIGEVNSGLGDVARSMNIAADKFAAAARLPASALPTPPPG